MDTRINLEIKIYPYENIGIPKASDSFALDLNQEELFFFKEEDNIFVAFRFDPRHVSIAYENSSDGRMVSVSNGRRICLSSGREAGNPPAYCPGSYMVWITIDGEKKEYFFTVEPGKVSMQTLMELRKYVNDFYSGLSEDFSKKRTASLNKQEQADAGSQKCFAFLDRNMPALLNYIHQYLNAAYTETSRKDKVERFHGRINSRSIRWLIQKGAMRNRDIYHPDVILLPRIEHSLNNPQNQLFKQELLYWNNELAGLIHQISSSKSRFDALASFRTSKLQDTSRQLQAAGQREKGSLLQGKKQYEGELASYQRQADELSTALNHLWHYKSSIENILSTAWVRDIPEAHSSVQPSDSRLKLIIGVHNSYRQYMMRSGGSAVFFEKSTPKLFETYLYILIINILKEAGYEMDSISAERDDLAVILSNPGRITMRNHNDYADIIYDMDLRNCFASLDHAQYVSIRSSHAQPDFIISFRNHDGSRQAAVVDAKWRWLRNIYRGDHTSDVIPQMADYLMLGYYDPDQERKLDKNGIARVIVVYPDVENEKVIQAMDDYIEFIGILPSSYIGLTEGYANLKHEILSVRSIQED